MKKFCSLLASGALFALASTAFAGAAAPVD
jgi:hypothetical protein